MTVSDERDIAEPAFLFFTEATVTARSEAGSRTWLARAQNLVLEYTTLVAGDQLRAAAEPDECVVLTPLPAANIQVRHRDQTAILQECGLIAVPPGDHTVVALETSDVVRLFTPARMHRVQLTMNAADYERPHPRVAPLTLWPPPIGQARLRRFAVADVAPDPGRFGNIYRTRAFMVNWLPPENGPRDPSSLSPHFHEDFEQISLAVQGEYLHHIRTPWTSRQSDWRDDQHQKAGSPSMTIIPPPTIHTSQSMGERRNALIDIFAGPRKDFSQKPGWVLNASQYPLPGSDL